jgi:hypothetical protein
MLALSALAQDLSPMRAPRWLRAAGYASVVIAAAVAIIQSL